MYIFLLKTFAVLTLFISNVDWNMASSVTINGYIPFCKIVSQPHLHDSLLLLNDLRRIDRLVSYIAQVFFYLVH